jgi:hypothetical protein
MKKLDIILLWIGVLWIMFVLLAYTHPCPGLFGGITGCRSGEIPIAGKRIFEDIIMPIIFVCLPVGMFLITKRFWKK